MTNHEKPCSDLQVAQNNISHIENYVQKDLMEKIEDVRSDLKSDFISVKCGSKLTAELLNKNVEEQREMRVIMSGINAVANTAKTESKEAKVKIDKLLFWLIVFFGGLITTNVVSVFVNINNPSNIGMRMVPLEENLKEISKKLSNGAIQEQIKIQIANHFKENKIK